MIVGLSFRPGWYCLSVAAIERLILKQFARVGSTEQDGSGRWNQLTAKAGNGWAEDWLAWRTAVAKTVGGG